MSTLGGGIIGIGFGGGTGIKLMLLCGGGTICGGIDGFIMFGGIIGSVTVDITIHPIIIITISMRARKGERLIIVRIVYLAVAYSCPYSCSYAAVVGPSFVAVPASIL